MTKKINDKVILFVLDRNNEKVHEKYCNKIKML